MKTRYVSVITVALAMLVISGCTVAPVIENVEPHRSPSTGVESGFSAEFVGRIDGSTATIPLVRTALQLLRGTDDGMHFNKTIEAYDNLIAGDKDIIFVTPPSVEELASASEAGVELEVIPIVKDALVFLANKANPVDGLTGQQVKDIYTGKTTNWKQVGGKNKSIIPYQRQVNSGSQTLFLQLAMGDTKPMDAPQGYYILDMSGLVDHVVEYDNSEQALGYSVFYFTQEMYVKESVKLLAIDGVVPSSETIADGSYAYLSNYYAVMRKSEPSESVARQLVEWCLTDEAQQLFSSMSYVPLDPRNIVPPVSGYGYQGSTPENTTQSSGTGGPAGWKAPYDGALEPNHEGVRVDSTGNLSSAKVPGNPKVEDAINDWLSEITQGTMRMPEAYGGETKPVRDLLQVSVHHEDNYSYRALIRLSDGHRMQLSDFFYDGVNYIDFINRTLLNEAANQHLVEIDYERIGPFTGLPAHTLDFSMSERGLTMFFAFAPSNPFLADPDAGYRIHVELNLPYDLSPYGYLWQTTRVQVNGKVSQHVVSNYQGVNPKDAKINAAVDAWVAKQTGNGQAVVGVDFDSQYMAEAGGNNDNKPAVLVVWALPNRYELSAAFDWSTLKKIS